MRRKKRIPLHEGAPETEAIEAAQLAFLYDPKRPPESAWTAPPNQRTLLKDWTEEAEDDQKLPEDGWIQE